MKLLRCSIRTAEVQTEKARAVAVAKRDAVAIAAIDTDETIASVAERLGVDERTVRRIQRAEIERREAAARSSPPAPTARPTRPMP